MMYQPHIETVLDRHDKAAPTVSVRQGFTVTGAEQDSDGVTLTGTDASGQTQSLRARYVIGADGGNGFARRTFAKELEDYGFQENWLVCDFHIKHTVDGLPMFRQICDPAQPISIVRIGPDHHRFSFMLEPGESPDQATDPARVWARVAAFLSEQDADLIRAVNYVFRSRITKQWRNGRVLLAGDAAHEMPPFLGQGMCSGIRDAHNLAWKLDLVLAGRAGEALLDTYQPEREPHVRFITEKAIELGRVQTLRDPEAARRRDEQLLALRRERRAPQKVSLPPLSGGLIANDGSFFPQARVRQGSRTALFDDAVGHGWCLVTVNRSLLDALPPALCAAWQEFGRIAVVGDGAPGQALDDLDGVYATWFRAHACEAALVRPDWYVYGTAGETAALHDLVQTLLEEFALGAVKELAE